MSRKFVIAFPGKRDNYQLVLALQEAELLSEFVTDLYYKGKLSSVLRFFLRRKIENRFHPELRSEAIVTRPLFYVFHILLFRFFQESKIAVWQDYWFSKAALKSARKNNANLILYEFQAEYAFDKIEDRSCKMILFQFHTHPEWEHSILLNDTLKYPQFKDQVVKNTRKNLSKKYAEHTKSAWRNADLIIVASSCTKKSLEIAGADTSRIVVVPYGFNESDRNVSKLKEDDKQYKPFFLFVGSGSHRKGLHHLCEAWKLSGLSQTHDLHVVARILDTGMLPFIKLDETIIWFKGVSKEELNWKYANATAFVMPSLSEGFGQVFLEALSNGCPVIGTRESMLSDLPYHPCINLVTSGDVKTLSEVMKKVGERSPLTQEEKTEIARLVEPFTWIKFRKSVVEAISKIV